MTWLAKWTTTFYIILLLLFGVPVTNRHHCYYYSVCTREWKDKWAMEIPSTLFFPSCKHLLISKPGNVFVPLPPLKMQMEQMPMWRGMHPAGAADLGAGNSTTGTASGIGSRLSKKECPRDERTSRNMVWVISGGARSDHQAAREYKTVIESSTFFKVDS